MTPKRIVPLFLFFFLVVTVFADPQFPENTGIQIVTPKIDYYPKGDITFNFQLYNSSNFLIPPSNNTNCTIAVYDGTGVITSYHNITPSINGYYINYAAVDVGDYYYTVYCYNNVTNGFVSANFKVTPDGVALSTNLEWAIIFGYLLLMIAFIFLIHTFKKDSTAIVIYGTTGGTLSLLFVYWLMRVKGYLDGALFYPSFIALCCMISLYLFYVGYLFWQDNRRETTY